MIPASTPQEQLGAAALSSIRLTWSPRKKLWSLQLREQPDRPARALIASGDFATHQDVVRAAQVELARWGFVDVPEERLRVERVDPDLH